MWCIILSWTAVESLKLRMLLLFLPIYFVLNLASCVFRYDTTMGGNWYKADEPWGAYLQTEGNPAVTIHPYESDPSSGSFNPQAHTTWVPVDWSSWPNYNVHGYGVY
jgi:hypothetical protein